MYEPCEYCERSTGYKTAAEMPLFFVNKNTEPRICGARCLPRMGGWGK